MNRDPTVARTRPLIPLGVLLAIAAAGSVSLVDYRALTLRLPDVFPGLPAAVAMNLLLAGLALRVRAVTASGAVSGAAVGIVLLSTSGWAGWMMLGCAFAVTVTTTRWRRAHKSRLGIAEAREGRRASGNIVANTGLGALISVVAFTRPSEAAWTAALVAALAASASDTVASEIGKGLGGSTWLLLPPRRVPPGTTGAVSAGGTIAALAAGGLFGLTALASGLLDSAVQAAIVAVAALLACVLEGVLAAVVEPRGVLDNDGMNFITSLAGAALAASAVAITLP